MERGDGERITPEKARALLREDGIEADTEQARKILDFLYAMAEIAVDCYLGRNDLPDVFSDAKAVENE